MFWILLSTVILWLLANLPTMYAASRFTPSTFFALWRIAPNQFLFDAICVPAGAFAVGCALYWTLRAAKNALATDQTSPWINFLASWPVVFLIGVALAASVSAAFFVSSAWSPDKLKTTYATSASLSMATIDHRLDGATNESTKQQMQDEISAAEQRNESLQLTSSNINARFGNLPSTQKVQILLSKREQRRLGILDDTAIAVSAFQILAVLTIVVVLLQTTILLYGLTKGSTLALDAEALRHAKLAIFVAIASFIPYPYFFGVYRSEVERVVSKSETGGQDLVATLAILVALAFLSLSEKEGALAFLSSGRTIIAAIAALAPSIASRTAVGSPLRSLIGAQSNVGTHVVLVILLIAIMIPFLFQIMPRGT